MPLFKQDHQQVPSSLLRDKFGWPPFSILNTISHDWQKRKAEWDTIIQDSTLGRDVKRYNATPTNTFSARGASAKRAESISTFDPYLTELMYRWFSLPKMRILDPFAGGVTRGSVASILGRSYTGIDLSQEQVQANITQYQSMCTRYEGIAGEANWRCGDSCSELRALQESGDLGEFDMVFTCPPYYNLEKYSKDPLDLSNSSSYEQFLNKYAEILTLSSQCLREDSFFVIVVSEVRESAHIAEQSYYVGLVPDTVQILRDFSNIHYYNEIILENNIGSLPIRAPKFFNRSRKIGRHHQNILVFYKGDISHIESKFGTLHACCE